MDGWSDPAGKPNVVFTGLEQHKKDAQNTVTSHAFCKINSGGCGE